MTNYNPGIIICTRLDSKRIPEKVLQMIGDKTILEILIERLLPAKIPICLAYPENEENIFYSIAKKYRISYYPGSKENVLERFYKAAELYKFNPIIRITHDNILQFPEHIVEALKQFRFKEIDYLSIKNGIPGTKFEIISFDVVKDAYNSQKNYKEYLTYPFRAMAENRIEYNMHNPYIAKPNLVIDYPIDLQLLRIIYEQNAFDMAWHRMIDYIQKNPTLMSINHRPTVSVYTCAYNAEKTIGKAIQSVIAQKYTDWEYIIVDDGSDDDTSKIILEQPKRCSNFIKVMRNSENIGLAKSSNQAISYTKGKYILRLDADDELMPDALEIMVEEIEEDNDVGIVYSDCWEVDLMNEPSYYYHFHDDKHENIGCALVKRAIWEEIKFNGDLEYADGLDFYLRVKELCKIAEIDIPLWKYNQRDDSMSKTGGKKREKVYREIKCNT